MGWGAISTIMQTLHLKKKAETPLAPAPATILGAPTPPDTARAASDATIAARQAAEKARKRAAAGSLLTTQPVGRTTPATLAPRTLIGAG
jgi:hypothetical protein